MPVLDGFARASGHELRNALNALVVNLEIVRSRSSAVDPTTMNFVQVAVDQSEESVRLAEGAISLINLVLGAVGNDGSLRIELIAPSTVRIAATETAAARTVHSLASLASRASMSANAEDAAVILSIVAEPDKKPR